MPLVTLEIPYGWFVLGLCALVAILLSPLVYYYRVKAIRKSHRAETVAWRAATLLKGFGSFELSIHSGVRILAGDWRWHLVGDWWQLWPVWFGSYDLVDLIIRLMPAKVRPVKFGRSER